jgi:hypothetical protein
MQISEASITTSADELPMYLPRDWVCFGEPPLSWQGRYMVEPRWLNSFRGPRF